MIRLIEISASILGIILAPFYFLVFVWFLRKRASKIDKINKADEQILIDRRMSLKGWILLVIGFINWYVIEKVGFINTNPIYLDIIVIVDIIVIIYAFKFFLKSIKSEKKRRRY